MVFLHHLSCSMSFRSEASSEPEYDSHKKSVSVDSIENVGKAEVSHFDQPQLIQPNEVIVNDVHLVERAEPVLSPKGLCYYCI